MVYADPVVVRVSIGVNRVEPAVVMGDVVSAMG